MTIVFGQVLQELAQLCGAVRAAGTATAGGASTLTDANELGGSIYPADNFAGARIYIWSGLGAGQERIILTGVAATGAQTVNAAWTTQPDATSKYLILERGWPAAQLRTAFLNAMRSERRRYMLPKVDETVTLDMDPVATYAYNVPAGFVAIQHILREYSPADGNFTVQISSEFWYINKTTTRQIVFDKRLNDSYGFLVEGDKVRIIGQAYETEPAADTATLSIPTGALILLAARNAYLTRGSGDVEDTKHHRSLANSFFDAYQRQKDADQTPIFPNSRLVEDS